MIAVPMTEGRDRRSLSLERVLADAAPTIIAMGVLSIAGLLWSLQSSISEVKVSQVRILDMIKDSQERILRLEERVRELEIKKD